MNYEGRITIGDINEAARRLGVTQIGVYVHDGVWTATVFMHGDGLGRRQVTRRGATLSQALLLALEAATPPQA